MSAKSYEVPASLREFKVICSRERKPATLLDLLTKLDKESEERGACKPAICFTNSTEASELIQSLISGTTAVSGSWRCDSYNGKKSLSSPFFLREQSIEQERAKRSAEMTRK